MSDVKIFATVVEDEAKKQVEILAEQKSFRDQKIRIMPDVHAGKGCVIGFTSTMGDYVIPNVVGVDIGCGMRTIELGKCELDLHTLDRVIAKNIPSGRNIHDHVVYEFKKIYDIKCYRELKDTKRFERSVGTLGGGNHFIEIDVDDEGNKYLIIHTGSRNLGNQVAEHYQKLAFKLRDDENTPMDLAYLSGKEKEDYLHDMAICSEYAVANRDAIAKIILEKLEMTGPFPSFETIHNYIDLDSMIIRKGAINADKGKRLLIPLNMRDGCIIAVGKGNADWNNSAPHGAGRIMSRTKAKAEFTMDEYVKSMEGIFTTSINKGTLDELPMAYKDMSAITDVIDDTVEIEAMIKPIYNFKAKE